MSLLIIIKLSLLAFATSFGVVLIAVQLLPKEKSNF